MSDFSLYAALFLSAFLSATLLPGSSEAMLVGLLSAGHAPVAVLVVVATAGNVLGSTVNWLLGRFFAHYRDLRWFPVSQRAYERAEYWYRRYGVWSLLLAWLPIVGDPLTLIAGVLRTDIRWFLVLVTAGKGARYLLVAAGFIWWSN